MHSLEKKTDEFSRRAVRYAAFYGGKIAVTPKVPVTSLDDFSIWYTPGVAGVSSAIAKDSDLAFDYTNRWNTVAVITDGSRVLGLGDIGPEASLPVMEGKALIYKYLGAVDAVPVPIRVTSEENFISIVKSLEPAFGGINLEDIASPKCFGILERLRAEMNIPVWHDDQQGTAGVVLAALYNALEVTGRKLAEARIVLFGSGAANLAAARLIIEAGCPARDLVLVDSKGVLHSGREDMEQLSLTNRWKYEMALKTNGAGVTGGLADALKGADVLIAASSPGPNTIRSRDIALMNRAPVVFVLANPVPEMWPGDAKEAGAAVVATGRSDFPNQVNNSLLFPAVFRGALDVRARTISDSMVISACKELANCSREKGLTEENIVPTMLDADVFPRVAAALGEQAQLEGIARRRISRSDLLEQERIIIELSRKASRLLVEGGVIPQLPS